MGTTSDFLSSLGFAAIVPFSIMFFKIGIDSFSMKKIEKLRMTNSKKMMIYLSQIVIFSFLLGLLLIFILAYDGNIDWKNKEGLFWSMLIVFFISFALTSVVFSAIHHYVQWLSVKIKFNIRVRNQDWSIVRRIDKEVILLEGERNNYKFYNVSQLTGCEIHEVLKKHTDRNRFSALAEWSSVPRSDNINHIYCVWYYFCRIDRRRFEVGDYRLRFIFSRLSSNVIS